MSGPVTGPAFPLVPNYGGREAAGFDGVTDKDCVTRSIAIGTDTPYAEVHDLVDAEGAARGIPNAAEEGPPMWVASKILGDRGWETVPVRRGAWLTEEDLPVNEHRVLIVEHGPSPPASPSNVSLST